MRTSLISTYALSQAARTTVRDTQNRLAVAQTEATTGRRADVGLALGVRTGVSVALRHHQARLEAITSSNALASSRMDASQSAMTAMVGGAQSLVSTLLAARSSRTGPGDAAIAAKSALQSFTELLNASVGGTSLFGGIDSDVAPMADFFASGSSNGTAISNAFQTAFGFPPGDPAAVNIDPASMTAFLDGLFASEFTDAAWQASWSQASSQNVLSRISTNQTVETSVNANEPGFRQLAAAYTMVAGLGASKLNANTFQVLADRSASLAQQGIAEIAKSQATLGVAQQRVATADQRMSIEMDLMTRSIGKLESVDPYEAATRVSELQTQLETSYALTARMQRLSLLDYLR